MSTSIPVLQIYDFLSMQVNGMYTVENFKQAEVSIPKDNEEGEN